MAQVTPVTALPADGVTAGAVQISGTGLRISARSANDSAQLSLIRMNPVSGKWWRVTETTDPGSAIVIPVKAYGDAQYKWSTDVNLSLVATSTNEYYHLLDNNGGTFSGYAEIESLSALAVGGTVPSARSIAVGSGLLINGGAAADLSADRTITIDSTMATLSATALTLKASVDLVGTAGDGAVDLSMNTGTFKTSTGANTLSGDVTIAANKALSMAAGTGAVDLSAATGTFKTPTGAGTLSGTTTIAANKNLLCAAGTTAVDLSLGTGTFKPPTGVFTFQGKQAATATANTIADPGNAGAIPVTTNGVCALTSAGAETRTLAIPTFMGQRLSLICDTYVGNIVVTSAQAINQAGNTVMTFNAAADYIALEAATVGGALRWRVAANDGVALS